MHFYLFLLILYILTNYINIHLYLDVEIFFLCIRAYFNSMFYNYINCLFMSIEV